MRTAERNEPRLSNHEHRGETEMETKNQSQNAGKVYFCPMHPEVRQPNPGKCPKCVGMYLVPEGTRFGMLRSMLGTSRGDWSPLKLFIMAAVMVAIIVAIMIMMR